MELTTIEQTATNVTFSLTIKHVGLLSQMSQQTGVNKSELVRRAIELLYKRVETVVAETEPTLADDRQLDE